METPREWMHTARDGLRLFVRESQPEGASPGGTILLTHGMGEHSGRYRHVVEKLNGAGLSVLSWDLRGHGRSEGRRGHIRSYDLLTGDLNEIWALAETRPIFLYGHSLGGQITLNFAARYRPDASGLIVTSPWLRLAFVPPRWKTALAWMAARAWPSFTQNTDVVPSRLSRDLAFLSAMPNAELVHHRMSARMYRELIRGALSASRDGVTLPYPALLIHGDHDPVTSVLATKEFFEALASQDKTLVIVPEALHETHNDLCREEVLGGIIAWLEAQLPQ